ncbi:hypothetical protein Q31b_05550 [Novipirellula aureliae]|uniref:STAS domain-containing protein n=1 Tax=Novipirellula aureliae TaxID=2527966 RepID=A0A5C6E6W2_9BACT|nr:STAS domain-containing protein [Novipirellula aureliae]TWU45383.1 hypothetical protein Q31b_05550 [Novipirellula aureliae]
MTTKTHFNVSVIENIPVIKLADSKFVDRLMIQETQDELIEYIQIGKPERLVISFEGVKSISSEFITTLLRCNEYVRSVEGDLILSCMSPVVRMAFQVTNLDGNVLRIHNSVINAIDSFRS